MFICCGDALFDLFAEPPQAIGRIALSGHVGGSPLNVAVGLARLGHRTGYLAKNSSDVFGQRIRGFLEANGIETDRLVDTARHSTLAIVGMRPDGSAEYAFYTDGTADRSLEPHEVAADLGDAVACLHVGSYSTAIEPTAGALLALIARESGRRFISYDPNIRPSIEPDMEVWRRQVAAYSGHAHFMKASDEDLRALYPGRSFEDVADEMIGRGVRLFFVTCGADGAVGFSADGRSAEARGVPVAVVDTVGAGDTFQAASLHWLADQGLLSREAAASADLAALMRFAITAAAITCSRRGADLPRLADIESFRGA